MLRVNPAVADVVEPPVTAAKRWIEHATITPDAPLLDLSQAVPGYPPAPELRAFLAEVVQRPDTSGYAPVAGLTHPRAKRSRRTLRAPTTRLASCTPTT